MLLSELPEGRWLSANKACAISCNCSEEKFGMELDDYSSVFKWETSAIFAMIDVHDCCVDWLVLPF